MAYLILEEEGSEPDSPDFIYCDFDEGNPSTLEQIEDVLSKRDRKCETMREQLFQICSTRQKKKKKHFWEKVIDSIFDKNHSSP
jgi:hypothetical protein